MGKRENENWDFLGLVNFGIFLILIGFIVATTPNFVERASNFFMGFTTEQVAPNIYLPVPKSEHPVLYTAVYQFCLVYALLHIPILIGRFLVKDSIKRKADTLSSIVFWSGMAVVFSMIASGSAPFRSIYYLFVIVAGIGLIVSGIGIYIARSTKRTSQSAPVYMPPQEISPR
jgi:hypothetical protein